MLVNLGREHTSKIHKINTDVSFQNLDVHIYLTYFGSHSVRNTSGDQIDVSALSKCMNDEELGQA